MRFARLGKMSFGIAVGSIAVMGFTGVAYGAESPTVELGHEVADAATTAAEHITASMEKPTNDVVFFATEATNIAGLPSAGSEGENKTTVPQLTAETFAVQTTNEAMGASAEDKTRMSGAPSDSSSIGGTPQPIAATPTVELPAIPQPQSTPSTEMTPAPSGSVLFRSEIIPVQPKIVKQRSIIVQDFAAMLPILSTQQPLTADIPRPAQPVNSLGHIAGELAGAVVPKAFEISAMAGMLRVIAFSAAIVCLMVLAVGFSTFSFVGRLRRGGYVHAARSDAASNLATPFRLGYEMELSLIHNPFLMVADIKTVQSMVCNAYRKEDMR